MADKFGQGPRLLVLLLGTLTLVALPIWFGSRVPGLFELSVGYRPEWPTATLETVIPLDERTGSREQWERYYMYGISAIGSAWVVVRVVQGWRFDREQFAFVPRRRHRSVSTLWRETGAPSPPERDSEADRRVDGVDDG